MNISATELPNFIRKCYLLHELLVFKYWRQNISVSNIASQYCRQALRRPAHRARDTVHLLTHETPDFITPALWPANSPDLNPVDYQIWRIVCTAARFLTSTSWSRAWSKSENISTRLSSIKRSGSGVHFFELAFEHTVDIFNTGFRCAEVLPFADAYLIVNHAWTYSWHSFWVALLNLL